jgi:hypothetical protein
MAIPKLLRSPIEEEKEFDNMPNGLGDNCSRSDL